MATTSDEILLDTDKVMTFDDTVEFTVQYPKDFSKKKYLKDGQVIELHKMQAEDWAARGLGKIGKSLKHKK